MTTRLALTVLAATTLLLACGRAPLPAAPRQAPAAAPRTLGQVPASSRLPGVKAENPPTMLPVGTKAPDFPMTRLDGTVEAFAAYRGHPVLLVFWATWCPVCTNELPHKQAIHDELGPKGLKVLCVNASNEKLQRLKDFVAWQGYTMPIFGQYTGAAVDTYQVSNIPTLYWISPKGVITDAHVGTMESAELRARSLKLLKGR